MATKPDFAPGQDMTDVSPADLAEAKERAKARKAYDESTTTTPAAPKPVKKARGGYVKAADGVTQRGKTRGKMV